MFFSDGKPSDYFRDFDSKKGNKFIWTDYEKVNKELVETMGELAPAQFGRRLSIHCIGMADKDENFSALSEMAKEATSFGVQATFNRPALNANSLSEIVASSVATSLSSKTELTSLKTGKLRSVRTDVVREKQNAPDDKFATGEWRVFLAADPERYVMRVWKWSARNEDFAQLIDPRCRFCYKTVASLR